MSEELTRAGEPLFAVTRRGYDQQQVDGYISQLQQQVRELQTAQTPDGAVLNALERVGSEVSEILKSAHESAKDIVAAAEREAADTKQSAERHAAHVVAVAEKRLQELDVDTDRIWAERERIVTDARDLARQLNGIADLANERFPDDPAPAAGSAAVEPAV